MGAFPPDVPVTDVPGSGGDSLNLKETWCGSHGRGARCKFQHPYPPDLRQVILFL